MHARPVAGLAAIGLALLFLEERRCMSSLESVYFGCEEGMRTGACDVLFDWRGRCRAPRTRRRTVSRCTSRQRRDPEPLGAVSGARTAVCGAGLARLRAYSFPSAFPELCSCWLVRCGGRLLGRRRAEPATGPRLLCAGNTMLLIRRGGAAGGTRACCPVAPRMQQYAMP